MRAAAGYDRSRWQSYIDTTRGTPPHIREQALANAIAFCGPDHILFGTDATLPGDMAKQVEHIRIDREIFDRLGLDAVEQERIFSGTADELFPPRK
jgi:hypothetical protein